MDTFYLLMAKYQAIVIPLPIVARDFFPHLEPDKLLRKISNGKIQIPLVRLDASSQKTAKGVHVKDLADYLDKQTEAARKECRQLSGSAAS